MLTTWGTSAQRIPNSLKPWNGTLIYLDKKRQDSSLDILAEESKDLWNPEIVHSFIQTRKDKISFSFGNGAKESQIFETLKW